MSRNVIWAIVAGVAILAGFALVSMLAYGAGMAGAMAAISDDDGPRWANPDHPGRGHGADDKDDDDGLFGRGPISGGLGLLGFILGTLFRIAVGVLVILLLIGLVLLLFRNLGVWSPRGPQG